MNVIAAVSASDALNIDNILFSVDSIVAIIDRKQVWDYVCAKTGKNQ